MKTVKTNLTEESFKQRLRTYTVPYEAFDKNCFSKNVFVLKIDNNKFSINCYKNNNSSLDGSDGRSYECLYGKYFLDESGKVIVRYRFGKPVCFLALSMIILLVSLPVLWYALYEMLLLRAVPSLLFLCAFFFAVVGSFGVFYRSPKQRDLYLKHLDLICGLN